MSFKSRLEADFKIEYQNVEFLFRQRPGLGGMAALPPSVAQVPGKYLCFLVTRVNDRNTIDPEHVMLALTRLRDFMIERGITEVSMPASSQEILLEHRLSRVRGGLELGMREESRVRCGGTKQVENFRGDWHDNQHFK